MLYIYCGEGDWYTKVSSLLTQGSYQLFNKDDYPQAGPGEWVVALQSGEDRLSAMDIQLKGSTINTFFKGCNNLDDVRVGKGLIVGCCSLIRPGTSIGNGVYIGAGTIIDNNCIIGDGVTIGDNVTINEGVNIPANTVIPSGSVVHIEE